MAKVDDALAMDSQEMIDGEDYFKSQLESFGKNTLLEPTQLLSNGPIDLTDSLIEDHNFFNGISPTAACSNTYTAPKAIEVKTLESVESVEVADNS